MKPLQRRPTAEPKPERIRMHMPIFPVEECPGAQHQRNGASSRQRVDHAWLAALLPVLVLFR
jgi:hypothetical protein